ncbi:hypothetical protein ACHAXS_010118 [Conticribra weissflogii]
MKSLASRCYITLILLSSTWTCHASAFVFSSHAHVSSRKIHPSPTIGVALTQTIRNCGRPYGVKRFTLSRLYVEKDDSENDDVVDVVPTNNSIDQSQPNVAKDGDVQDDDEEDDEEDVITQKLRRNAIKGPINPVKEHDKMLKDNQDEAQSNNNGVDYNLTNAAINISNSNSNSDSNSNITLDEFLKNEAEVLAPYILAQYTDPNFNPLYSAEENYLEAQFKELLGRKGEDLSRLGPGIATLPLDPTSEEAMVEKRLASKETALQKLVEDMEDKGELSRTNLAQASELKAEIEQLHFDDCGAVLLANMAFYDAFSSRDIDAMKEVWWHSASSICVHPGHSPLIGYNAILESFDNIFLNSLRTGRGEYDGVLAEERKLPRTTRMKEEKTKTGIKSNVFMTPTNIRGLSVRGTTASLVCDEEVYSRGSSVLANKLLTTNVFRKIGGKWKMSHRHASWHPETNAAQKAMKAKPGLAEGSDKNVIGRQSSKKTMTIQKFDGNTSNRRVQLPSIPPSLEGLDTNSILGINKKEEESKNKKSKKDSGMKGQVISLSDFLGGRIGSSDDDAVDDKSIADALADMISGSATSDSTRISGSGTPDDPFVTRRIIRIGPDEIDKLAGGGSNSIENYDNDDEVEDQDYDENEHDDEDDDEEVRVIDLRGKSKDECDSLIAKILADTAKEAIESSKRKDSTKRDNSKNKQEPSVIDLPATPTSAKTSKDSLRQRCIATIRKLSEDGQLSQNQKRALLTDIITSSANGDKSVIEIAYEILCVDANVGEEVEEDAGVEDFTEQCRVFAAASLGEED